MAALIAGAKKLKALCTTVYEGVITVGGVFLAVQQTQLDVYETEIAMALSALEHAGRECAGPIQIDNWAAYNSIIYAVQALAYAAENVVKITVKGGRFTGMSGCSSFCIHRGGEGGRGGGASKGNWRKNSDFCLLRWRSTGAKFRRKFKF